MARLCTIYIQMLSTIRRSLRFVACIISHFIYYCKNMASELNEIINKWKDSNLVEKDLQLLDMLSKDLIKLEESVSQFGIIRFQVSSFTKLLCDPWMENQVAFDEIYYHWGNFLLRFKSKVGGMTIVERLCYFGLMDEFEESTIDRKQRILQEVFIDEESIRRIINPEQ